MEQKRKDSLLIIEKIHLLFLLNIVSLFYPKKQIYHIN